MVIRVTVLSGPEANTSVDGSPRITIGSASYCNLRLSGRGILAVHAEINATAKGLHLRSFSSTGTRVGGRPVTDHYPSPEEEVEFGEGHRVRIEAIEEGAEQPPAPAARQSRASAPSRSSSQGQGQGQAHGHASAGGAKGAAPKDNKILGFPPVFVAAYLLVVIGVFAFLAFGVAPRDAAQAYRQVQKDFTAQATKAGLSEDEIKARWRQVERAYSLERTGHTDEAIAEYLRILALEGTRSPKGPLWTFSTRRVAALRAGNRS